MNKKYTEEQILSLTFNINNKPTKVTEALKKLEDNFFVKKEGEFYSKTVIGQRKAKKLDKQSRRYYGGR
ncbi:hypothetical protein HGB13_01140 [bacterium]|nr:hypothetical protein [bacterium]